MDSVHCIVLDNEQGLLAKATLVGALESTSNLQLKPDSYDANELKRHTPVIVRLFDTSNGLVSYHGETGELRSGILEVNSLRAETYNERREDVKVFVNRPATIITKTEENEVRKTTAHLRDLSAGGVCIISGEYIAEGGQIELVFDLEREPDILQLEVLRRIPGEDGTFSYGCRFASLHPTQESKVRSYVFKKHQGLISRGDVG